MDNIMIKNAQGEQLNINVVRYFRLNGVEYLIFSLNEIDEGGYVKLYISKVNGDLANTIADDVEWNLIKDTVKTIIKANKDNTNLPITDLDTRKINNIQILDQKVFKLGEAFIQLLSANKNVEAYVEQDIPVSTPELPVIDTIPTTEEVDFNSIQQNPFIEPVASMGVEENVQANELQYNIPEEPRVQPVINEFINPVNVETTEETISENATDLNLGNDADYGLDYKILYENELNKNKLLVDEVEKYKEIINNLKNIISETETF